LDSATENSVVVQGVLVESDALRYSPAGIPILRFRLAHQSRQLEAGAQREVGCEIETHAFETEAKFLASAPLGTKLRVEGFLDRKGKSSRQIVLHARKVQILADKAN